MLKRMIMASDKAQYIVALIAEFAEHYGLTTAQAAKYLSQYKDYTLPHAVEAVYSSNTYNALLRPQSNMYFQSSRYVFSLLNDELNNRAISRP